MYVMTINFSGNSGKSTISDNMLAPRMENAEIIRVETINAHEGDDADNLKGKEYGQIIDGLALFENAVVDVGSSNVQDLMNLMDQYSGSHEIFDYFVVPTVARPKQIRDTIKTIETLSDIGIQPEKIRVVFNMVDGEDTDLEKEFHALFAYHAAEQKFTLNSGAVVYQNDFYSRVAGQGTSIETILADTTDYNKLLKEAETPEEKIAISQKRGLKFLANGLKVKLDKAFSATFE
ncbi:StbB family protein [Pseudomonas aeruginosa]